MHTTNLRKVGGSVMLAVPPAVLDMLQLQAGATVALVVDGGRLIVEAGNLVGAIRSRSCWRSAMTPRSRARSREWLAAPGQSAKNSCSGAR